LKLGEAVTVNGFLAKDGSHYVNAVTVKLGDGKTVFAGSSGDRGRCNNLDRRNSLEREEI